MTHDLDYSVGDLGNELHNICCRLAATDNTDNEDLAYELEAIVVKLWRLNAAKDNSDTLRLRFLVAREARIEWGDGRLDCAVYFDDADVGSVKLNGSRRFSDPRKAIDDAMERAGFNDTMNGPSDTPDVGEWKLYLCDPTSGKEGLHEKSTDKTYILDKLQKNFDHDLDVWVIAPDGRKILPNSETMTPGRIPQPCARITSTLDAGAGRFFNVEWLNVSELKEGSILYLNPPLEKQP